MKKILTLFFAGILLFSFVTGCDNHGEEDTIKSDSQAQKIDVIIEESNTNDKSNSNNTDKTQSAVLGNTDEATKNQAEAEVDTASGNKVDVVVNATVLTATLSDNSSAEAFAELLSRGDLTIEMQDYGNFEKVGALPEALERNDEQITTVPGDIILYQGNQIAIYYDTNTWNFTRLGKIDSITGESLKALLGKDDVTVTFRLHRDEPIEKSSTLIAYFSATGTTKHIAEQIKDLTNADIYEIAPTVPYTDDDLAYYTDCRADKEQKDFTARPGISGNVFDFSKYEAVILGYPIWHGQAPRIISTFLESYDFSGKTILPFCTSHSSGIGSSDTALHTLAQKAVWLDGKRFSSSTTKEEIRTWLEDMNVSALINTCEFDFEKKAVPLNDGREMPIIGLGTWTLSNEEAEKCVYHALKCGMRLIDTARYYQCEIGVGRGIKRAIIEGFVRRDDIFVTSKIMPADYDRASQGINDSLRGLDLDYIDLMLIHQPGSNDKTVYKAIEKAVLDGKVKSIGISNYYTKQALDEVLSYAEIIPAVIQNENHLFYQNTELQEYAKRYGIVIESWYPFGGRGHTGESFNHATIKALAEKYKKSSAQIILRWQMQAGYVVIPGSGNTDHISENFDVFDFELSAEEMTLIAAINTGVRYENW